MQCKVGCRWTTENILPASGNAIWGSGPTDVYLVGKMGIILHSTGDGKWTSQVSGTTADLHAIWGSGASDVYAAGTEGTIVHSTGDGTWTQQRGGGGAIHVHYEGIWGSGPADVYIAGGVAGSSQTLLHTTGDGKWEEQILLSDPGNLSGVWGSSSQDIYAVGTSAWSNDGGGGSGGPVLLHSKGTGSWTGITTPTTHQGGFSSVWLGGPGDVYVVGGPTGESSFRVSSDGKWTPVPADGYTVWGLSSNDMYILSNKTLYHSVGDGTWTAVHEGGSAIWATGGCNLYIVADGTVTHRL